MIVYGNREERVNTRSHLQEILRIADPLEAQIRFGQFESAIVDALCPEVDDWTPVTEVLRESAHSGNYARALGWDLPSEVCLRPAEGFAWYAVYPEQYAAAARRFVREAEPDSCVTVGIRSIGTTLSTIVRRVVGGATFTVRPRGHAFDRHIRVTPALMQLARQGRWALVVDEGPGLSGSSFIAACDMLLSAGFPEDRIVLFPAHEPDPSKFASARARTMWKRFRKYVEPFRPELHVPPGAVDLSGGAWRSYLGVDAPVVPQLERRKYLDEREGVLWKWAGLGHYGRKRLERASRLDGFIPTALSVEDGFLLNDWLDGMPVRSATTELLDRMGAYLAHVNREFRTSVPVNYADLSEMIRVNTGLEVQAPEVDTTRVALDGRMLPHEWLSTAGGYMKTDALDHHDDHLFPGSQDVAWDIAGAAIEFGFDPNALADRYLREIRDGGLRQRLPFHMVAYAAYRAGFAALFGQDTCRSRYLRAAQMLNSST